MSGEALREGLSTTCLNMMVRRIGGGVQLGPRSGARGGLPSGVVVNPATTSQVGVGSLVRGRSLEDPGGGGGGGVSSGGSREQSPEEERTSKLDQLYSIR